jgi:hypothetical protein
MIFFSLSEHPFADVFSVVQFLMAFIIAANAAAPTSAPHATPRLIILFFLLCF